MKKRIQAVFLALCVLMGSTSTYGLSSVHAETLSPEVVRYVNPLYEGVIDENDLNSPESGPALYAQTVYETDENILKEEIKQAMIDRCENFTIYYETKTDLPNDFLLTWVEEVCEHTGEAVAGDYIRWHYGGVSYQGQYTKYSDGRRQYVIDVAFTYYTTAEQEEELTREVENLIQSLNLTNVRSDYEKIKLVYDYVCANISYDNDNLNDETYMLKFTAYAALLHKKAVCQGYGSLIYRILNEVGVDTRFVAGFDHNGGGHGWNLVELDGTYYYIDATWDAGRSEYNYFLKGKKDFPKHTATSDFVDWYNISDYEYVEREEEEIEPLPFTDLDEGSWYYQYVAWAYENEVANGILQSDGTYKFEPDSSCTRAQFVRFLWNLVGTPVSEEVVNPFTDLDEEAWYYEAVMWAVENGVTSGVQQSDGTYVFNPNETCTRAQAARFLYNIAGELKEDVENPFTDVEEDKWYYTAIMWGCDEGVIAGMQQSDGTYKYFPDDNVTRAQVVKLIKCTFEE